MASRETYTEKQFLPMEVSVHDCGSGDHLHVLVGVISDLAPSIGEFVAWDADRELWFRPLEEILISLN